MRMKRWPGDLVAGDERALVQPALTAIHTLWLQEHNRFVNSVNLPNWLWHLFRVAVHLKSELRDFLKGKSFQERDDILFQVNSTPHQIQSHTSYNQRKRKYISAKCFKFFQETRRLVSAEFQNIVYSEYLPIILGSAGVKPNFINSSILTLLKKSPL